MKVKAFDWDDNCVSMPTMIIMFKNNNPNNKVYIPTDIYAKVRNHFGEDFPIFIQEENNRKILDLKSGMKDNLKFYNLIFENEASFEEFIEQDENIFLRDLKIAIKNKSFAPAYNDFVSALECPEQSLNTYIITARGQAPESIYKALMWMKNKGMIKNIIPLNNIHPVAYDGGKKDYGSHRNNSLKKLNLIKEILQDKRIEEFEFSDDDIKTYKLVKENLQVENVKLNLYYTGNGIKEYL